MRLCFSAAAIPGLAIFATGTLYFEQSLQQWSVFIRYLT
jgi:hypothetical protein